MESEIQKPEVNTRNEIQMPEKNVKNEIQLPEPVLVTPREVSASVPLSLARSQNKLLVTIFNDEYSNKDGGDVEKLSAIKENAQMIAELLKNKFGYEMPSEEDPTIFEPGQFENQAKLVKTFEKFLKKWKRAQPVGRTIDRFVLYYHGHGVQVMGHPCLLTSQWEAIPLDELVNLVGTYVNPSVYYVITDCCANNKTFRDEATLERVEKATTLLRARDFQDKEVTISATPPGYTADARGAKTFTASLVSVLEQSLEKGEAGVPLHQLQGRLRKEQAKHGSNNFPIIAASLELKNVNFPL